MEICERIKNRRLEIGMTLLEEAQSLGVAEATAQRYESGKIKTLKYDTIVRLAEILRCTPAYLMGWEEDILFPQTGSGIINVEDELKMLLSRIETSHTVKYGEKKMSESSIAMLKNSIDGIIQNLSIITE